MNKFVFNIFYLSGDYCDNISASSQFYRNRARRRTGIRWKNRHETAFTQEPHTNTWHINWAARKWNFFSAVPFAHADGLSDELKNIPRKIYQTECSSVLKFFVSFSIQMDRFVIYLYFFLGHLMLSNNSIVLSRTHAPTHKCHFGDFSLFATEYTKIIILTHRCVYVFKIIFSWRQ